MYVSKNNCKYFNKAEDKVPSLNRTTHHEDILNGGIPPRILNLGTGWK
jgi:hypothetical protein